MCVCAKLLQSCLTLCLTLWTVARQAPLSMGFARQEYWSRLPCPPPEDLPDPGTKPPSLTSPALAGRLFTIRATWEAHLLFMDTQKLTSRASLVAQIVNNRPAIWETWVRFLGWEDPLEKGMTTQSSILAWRIRWTEERGRLQSMGLQRVRPN